MEDVKKFLAEKKGMIDSTIESYIPRELDEKSIEWMLGKAKYKYNLEAPQKTIIEPMWEFLDRGGKRWRPALLLLVNEALGGEPEKIKDLVVIPEVIHNATLMHDDIEDGSEMRRGKECTYRIYGMDVAINLGDVMFFLPYLVLLRNRMGFDEKTIKKAYDICIQEMINICFGQAMDIYWHNGHGDDITEEEYLQMCAYKTGTLARLSAKLGALFAGADEKIVEKLGDLAESIGVAFQIQDDILNILPRSQDWGKEVGDDIKEGKRSLMVIHTLRNGNDEDRRRIIEILDKPEKSEEEIMEAIEILKRNGSVDYARECARRIVREAWAEADKILPESSAKRHLAAFAQYLIERDV